MKHTHWLYVPTLLLVGLAVEAQERQVPHQFVENQPAYAEEVNANFNYVTQAIDAISQHEFSIEVDCTDDPWGLQKAYRQGVNYRELNFATAGTCYGDIFIVLDEEGAPVVNDGIPQRYQVKGQSINIHPSGDGRVAIIPNPVSGITNLAASFGGGLYLDQVDITLGENDSFGVLFSRNGHGDIYASTITGNRTDYGHGVAVQEGAQVYISDLTVTNLHTGISSFNGGVLRFLGPIVIENTLYGITGRSSVFRQQAEITLAASNDNLALSHGSSWLGWGMSLTANGAPSYIDNTSFEVGHYQSDANLYGSGAKLMVEQFTANRVEINNNSNLSSANLTTTEQLVVASSSVAHVDSGALTSARVYSQSLLGGGYSVNDIEVYDSKLETQNATLNGPVLLDRSRFNFFESTVLADVLLINSQGFVDMATEGDLTRIHCHGMSVIDIDGTDITDELMETACMSSNSISEFVLAQPDL